MTYIKLTYLRILGRNFFDYINHDDKEKYLKYLSSIFHKEPSMVDYAGKLRVNPKIILKETRELLKNSNNNAEDNKILQQLERLIEEKIQIQQDLGFDKILKYVNLIYVNTIFKYE